MSKGDELLSVPEVARMVEVSERMVREAIHTGVLEADKVGASWAVRRGDAEAWAEDLDEEDAEAEAEAEEEAEEGDEDGDE